MAMVHVCGYHLDKLENKFNGRRGMKGEKKEGGKGGGGREGGERIYHHGDAFVVFGLGLDVFDDIIIRTR